MAAGLGFKTFIVGDVLTAADTNGYLMQGVLVFATAAARDVAITSPQQGQTAYLKDSNTIVSYSGSAWVTKSGSASPLTTKGDLYGYSTADARVAVGANGTVLTADSTAATGVAWATASASMTSIASGSLSGASLAISSISGSYKNLRLVLRNFYAASDVDVNIKINSLSTLGDYGSVFMESTTTNNTAAAWTSYYNSTQLGANFSLVDNTDGDNTMILDIFDYADTTCVKIANVQSVYKRSTGQRTMFVNPGFINTTSAVTAITVTPTTANWSAGTYTLYGVN